MFFLCRNEKNEELISFTKLSFDILCGLEIILSPSILVCAANTKLHSVPAKPAKMTHIISHHISTTPAPSPVAWNLEKMKNSVIAAVILHRDIKQTAITRVNKRAAKNTPAS